MVPLQSEKSIALNRVPCLQTQYSSKKQPILSLRVYPKGGKDAKGMLLSPEWKFTKQPRCSLFAKAFLEQNIKVGAM